MILKKLVIKNFGPFHFETTLDIDPDVTILTGQNDVGKSSVLRLIYLMCNSERAIQSDANVDRFYSSRVAWDKDGEISCLATFIKTPIPIEYISSNVQIDAEIDIEFALTRNQRDIRGHRYKGEDRPVNNVNLARLPTIISLPLSNELSTTISTESATSNQLHEKFLRLGFGENAIPKLAELMPYLFEREIRQAEDRINDNLKSFLPQNLGLRFALSASRDPVEFNIGFRDVYGGDTPIHFRGTGVRKIVALMISLLGLEPNQAIYILFDEPENSLHADAQHFLRNFLEELSKSPNIQIIYATHSPSMINPIKRNGLRLLERTANNNIATTVVNNRPFENNFLPVRVSLGLSPIDSLLYAPITIILEGETEVSCLPILLEMCSEKSISGFEDLDQLWALSHVIDGQGDNFLRWCHMAKSQGAHPIIFVDGDKIRRVRQYLGENPDNVPIINLDENQEFEDIVPKETYFIALADCYSIDATIEKFNEWKKQTSLPSHMMFSKQVNRWLEDKFPDVRFYKPQVMKKALEIVDLDKVQLDRFRELVSKMRILADEITRG